VSGIHRHKWSGAAACAWGAGDTKPGQPALLPRLRCSPLLRVSGSGMHMGGTLSTLFWFFFFFSFYIFYFCGDPKMGYNRCPLFIILTEQRFCVVSFIKINKTEFLKLILLKLDRSETLSLWLFPFNPKQRSKLCHLEIPIWRFSDF
jgi:hypothetical protein